MKILINKMMSSETENLECLNCFTTNSGNFCPNCGQDFKVKQIHFKDILFELIQAFMPWNNKWGYNLKEMLLRPGITAHKYLRGERVRFFQPISLMLGVIATYLILAHFFDYDIMKDGFNVQELNAQSTPDDVKMNKAIVIFSRKYDKFLDYWEVIFLISSSLASYTVFRKTQLTFGEHIIFNSIVAVGEYVIIIVFIPWAAVNSEVDSYVVTPILVSYVFYAFYQFFNPYYPSKTKLIFRVIGQIILAQLLILTFIFIPFFGILIAQYV
jgi:hypothetical protein